MEKTQSISISIIDHFASVDDPRMERTRKHKLGDIIAVAIRAVIAGADGWVDIETFGNAKIDWFKTFLELPNGIPSHDTFGRVFSLIDARNFQDLFIEWTKRVWEATEGQVVAIDGKTVRRSADKTNGESPIHMVSAWATANGVALGHANDRGEWADMNSVAMIESTRWINGATSVHRRYFITSLPARAGRILGAVREHWGVENGLHWTLGAPFGEDGSMIRIGQAAENMSTLRRLALNLVKGEKSLKIGVAAKRKRAGWDLEYLRTILRLAQ